jgi:pyruvate dehydrogenase E2 component (dihydrolipoamide acetyltransferase)
MATHVEVPKLGNTVEECIVARWCKRQGDAVFAGDIVAEIETDKATFEVAAPVTGTLIATFYDEGALAPVFTRLFVIGEPGESYDGPGGADLPASASPAAEITPQPVHIPTTEPRPQGSGAVVNGNHAAAFSPRARKFARDHNFNPSAVAGSGPHGRILEQDLRKLYNAGSPVSKIREKIARRMRESLASTAQYTLHASADATGLLAARARFKRTGHQINVNDLVAFCTIEALLEIPSVNAEFVDGRIRQHSHVNLGFACDTPRGLLVPVVNGAESLCLDELAARMKDLAAQAVAGSISPDDLSGATFTISNLGGLGIEAFTPLLNPPQVAILGVGSIQLKPARRHGQIEFLDTIGLSLTCDHQVIDGAPGARFLKVLAGYIENVESLLWDVMSDISRSQA